MECATTMSEEETAFKRQPGLRCSCRMHAVSSTNGEVAVGGGTHLGVICQHALDPGLALHAHIADQCWPKTWHKPKSCLFNILIQEHIYTGWDFTSKYHILADIGNANIYGPLWTPTCICTRRTYFFIFFMLSFMIFTSKDIITLPHHPYITKDNYYDHGIMYDTTLLYSPVFTPHSPVISNDFSP